MWCKCMVCVCVVCVVCMVCMCWVCMVSVWCVWCVYVWYMYGECVVSVCGVRMVSEDVCGTWLPLHDLSSDKFIEKQTNDLGTKKRNCPLFINAIWPAPGT